jgi:hypothetical protein
MSCSPHDDKPMKVWAAEMDQRRRSRRRPKLEDGGGAPRTARPVRREGASDRGRFGENHTSRRKRKQGDRVTSPTAESSGVANTSRRPELDGDGASA